MIELTENARTKLQKLAQEQPEQVYRIFIAGFG